MWYTRMVDDEIGVFGLRWCGIEIAQLIILCELLVAVSLVHKEQKQMLVDPMWSLLSPASDAFFSILPFVFLSRRGARRETNPTGNFSGGLVTGWEFYLYAIKKDGDDLCAIKKVSRTCVPPS
jgi:hypothetical protein